MVHIRRINESSANRTEEKSYQLSLLINRLYTASRPFTMHSYSDEGWQNVTQHIDALRKVRGVIDISVGAPDGGYRNYYAGRSIDFDHPAYKEYRLEIETEYGIVIGRLICHSAGSMDDAFSRYDMTCTFWNKNIEA